ncbi:MAG: HNH endonuclease [Gammaproteobacteria bacterium]|nr:HNH endonuclease [Gammaproteobacteria bacterium]
MGQGKKLYVNKNWAAYSERVKRRDGFKCLRCGRGPEDVTLQVHHNTYITHKAPWEYALSDCRTLCKGCHAREHDLIEPDRGWTLLSIHDLGGPAGNCERKGCGAEIRYAHYAYHPNWGYLVVGSTCVEYLTRADRLLSSNVIHLYKNISDFVNSSEWSPGFTQKGKKFIRTTYRHHQIRLYGDELSHSFQIVLKEKGVRWHNFAKAIFASGKSTTAVKELAYIALRGMISKREEEKELLRSLYRELKINT